MADWNRDGVQDLIIGRSVATVNGGEYSDELSWEWEGRHQGGERRQGSGLYPPRPKPTAESIGLAGLIERGMSEKEAEEHLAFNIKYWEDNIGRLYKDGKAYWLTMRHQGRVYVMLGPQPGPKHRGQARVGRPPRWHRRRPTGDAAGARRLGDRRA